MARRLKRIKLALALVALNTLAACHPLRASIGESVPPSFTFSSGLSECCDFLTFFMVEEVPPENQTVHWLQSKPRENIVLWPLAEGDNSDTCRKSLTEKFHQDLSRKFRSLASLQPCRGKSI
jgi:hypothetical protein